MQKITKKIFLIEPNEQSKYQTMLVFSESADMARHVASAKINPMRIKVPEGNTPIPDTVYLDEKLSKATEINPEIINKFGDSVQIKYLGNEYILTNNFAVPLVDESN